MNKMIRSYLLLLLAIGLGVGVGFSEQEYVLKGAEAISLLFTNFLQLLAGPIVFLSILATLLGTQGFNEMKLLGRKVFGYTILTTLIASLVALILFLVINPLHTFLPDQEWVDLGIEQGSYFSFFLKIVPSNLIEAFLHNQVISLAFVAIVLGFSGLKLPEENRKTLSDFFSSLFQLALKATGLVVVLLPIAIFAFTAILVGELKQNGSQFEGLSLYLCVVLGANLVQGLIVLPLLLKFKKISPWRTARGASKALIMAFFSKSSNATLPLTIQSAEGKLGIKSRTANFVLPLCTVINMNGCAAFILTTVLFVSGMHGVQFSPLDLGLWAVLATIAAIGNAGVPMGCFFLSSAFLITMGVPIKTMGLILPFYAFLDMVETALNVWSDVCVTAVIDQELKEEQLVQKEAV